MKTTLPTLSEIVDITADMAYDGNFITNHIWDYNDFLKQPLKLWMFIPCKDGVPLEKPKMKLYAGMPDEIQFRIEQKEYQQAKDRVIFKGNWKIKEDTMVMHTYCVINDKLLLISLKDKSISDLSNKVDLTDKEFKRLGL